MIRSSFKLIPNFISLANQTSGAAPVLYFKKGCNMKRVRKIKKGDPTFCVSLLLLTALSAVYICSLRFSLAPLLKGSCVGRLAKNKNTLTIFGSHYHPLLNLLTPSRPFIISGSLQKTFWCCLVLSHSKTAPPLFSRRPRFLF